MNAPRNSIVEKPPRRVKMCTQKTELRTGATTLVEKKNGRITTRHTVDKSLDRTFGGCFADVNEILLAPPTFLSRLGEFAKEFASFLSIYRHTGSVVKCNNSLLQPTNEKKKEAKLSRQPLTETVSLSSVHVSRSTAKEKRGRTFIPGALGAFGSVCVCFDFHTPCSLNGFD